jgi:hypothetical protein
MCEDKKKKNYSKGIDKMREKWKTNKRKREEIDTEEDDTNSEKDLNNKIEDQTFINEKGKILYKIRL